MKNVIIYATNTGTTEKVAQYILDKLSGETYSFAIGSDEIPASLDATKYVFGTNIRMFAINRKFKKQVKAMKNTISNKNIYCFICSCNVKSREKYIQKVAKLFNETAFVDHVGGEADVSRAKGFDKKVLQSVVDDCKKKNQPLPEITWEKVDQIIDMIKEGK